MIFCVDLIVSMGILSMDVALMRCFRPFSRALTCVARARSHARPPAAVSRAPNLFFFVLDMMKFIQLFLICIACVAFVSAAPGGAFALDNTALDGATADGTKADATPPRDETNVDLTNTNADGTVINTDTVPSDTTDTNADGTTVVKPTDETKPQPTEPVNPDDTGIIDNQVTYDEREKACAAFATADCAEPCVRCAGTISGTGFTRDGATCYLPGRLECVVDTNTDTKPDPTIDVTDDAATGAKLALLQLEACLAYGESAEKCTTDTKCVFCKGSAAPKASVTYTELADAAAKAPGCFPREYYECKDDGTVVDTKPVDPADPIDPNPIDPTVKPDEPETDPKPDPNTPVDPKLDDPDVGKAVVVDKNTGNNTPSDNTGDDDMLFIALIAGLGVAVCLCIVLVIAIVVARSRDADDDEVVMMGATPVSPRSHSRHASRSTSRAGVHRSYTQSSRGSKRTSMRLAAPPAGLYTMRPTEQYPMQSQPYLQQPAYPQHY